MKTIYNTYVVIESQEQCDRMKKLCIDNDLGFYDDFRIDPEENGTLYIFFEFYNGDFCNYRSHTKEFEVTEQEFKELLKTK